MHLLQGVDALLELNVVGWQLSLEGSDQGFEHAAWTVALACLEFTFSSAWPSCSLTYCDVREAKGVKEALQRRHG